MKLGRIAVGVMLVGSLALDVLLWREALRARAEAEASHASATEVDQLRTELDSLKKPSATAQPGVDPELVRLRGEIGPLRKQAAEANALRAQASEAARLNALLQTATQELAVANREVA